MKKLALFFSMIVMIFVFAMSANAAEIVDSGTCGLKGDNVKWTLDSEGVVVVSGEGQMYYYDFYEKEYPPIYEDDRVEKVIIKEGVTTVAPAMFYKCKNLKTVILEGYVFINEEAFSECENLRFVYTYKGFDEVEDSSFAISVRLDRIIAASGAKVSSFNGLPIYKNAYYDGEYAYQLVDGKAKLVGVDPCEVSGVVTLPEKVDGYDVAIIGSEALSKSLITKLIVPDSITKLEDEAFSGFTTLEEATVGKGITALPYAAFRYCGALKKVTLPDTITKFDTLKKTYYGAEYDSNVGAQFANCTSLEEIELPSELEYIPASTFSNCRSLKSIVIPDSVKDFLPSFQIVPGNSITELTVKNVYSYAFDDCDSLENIVLPVNLKSIPSRTFYHCDNLTEVYIPGSVTEISEEAFKNCAKLESVIIGTDKQIKPLAMRLGLFPVAQAADETALNIGQGAFENCSSLVFVSIDKSLTSIAENAFNECGNITDIFYNGSEEDWNKITIGANNDDILSARKHYNTESQYTHPFETQTVYVPTCTLEGLMKCKCSCGYEFDVKIDAKGHNLKGASEKITKEPTCYEEGEKTFYCSDCRMVAQVWVLDKLEHNLVRDFFPGSMKRSGIDITSCTLCNTVISRRVIPKITEIKVWDGKTCTEKGEQPVIEPMGEKAISIDKANYTVKYSGDGKTAGEFIATITFKGDYEGETTVRYEILPGVAKNLKATPSQNTIKLSWDKVYGAYGYRIYKYNEKTKKYDVVTKLTTKNSYTVKDLKAGTEYKFKVTAYGKSEWGAVLSTNAALISTKTSLETVKITSLTSSAKGKAVIKWGDIAGETGYQVYYCTSKNGTYKRYGTYKDGKLTATVTGLTSGKTYYFKVRAYDKSTGKTVYGSFSSIKSVKIK